MKGTIVKSISNLYTVLCENELYTCNASSKLKRNKNQLIIGDIVEFDIISGRKGYITNQLVRHNSFIRPKVANVKFSFLVFSIVEPNMNWNLLDKFLVSCENNYVNPIIIITKRDLANETEKEFFYNKISYYDRWYKVIYNDDNSLIDDLKLIVQSDLTFLMGQSGVGKSTLLNKIDSSLDINTNDISMKLNRGKHTTRHTELFNTHEMNIIDTPGFGMLSVDNLSIENLKSCFIDFFEMSSNCKFGARCNHISENNCYIKEELIKGNILKSRYDSYIELFSLSKEKKW